jgi:hypothetical protein
MPDSLGPPCGPDTCFPPVAQPVCRRRTPKKGGSPGTLGLVNAPQPHSAPAGPPSEPWFSVRCLFRHLPASYEERITLWRAGTPDEAVTLAEADARDYAKGLEGAEYLGLAQAFHLFEAQVGDGTEIFSLVRDSDLAPDDYLDAFFDTGGERQHDLPADDD